MARRFCEYSNRLTSTALGSALIMSTVACQITSSDPDDTSSSITVRDGRLRFADIQAFVGTVAELDGVPPDQLAPDHLADRYNGFRSLAMMDLAARPDIPHMTATMMAILAPDGTYEVGERIFMFRTNAEYVIPDDKREIVARLAAGESAQPYITSGQIQFHELSRIEWASPDVSALTALNAKYQYEFERGNVWFKFVDEVQIDTMTQFVTVRFRSKLEYLDESTLGRDVWRHASEHAFKRITSSVIDYQITPGMLDASVSGVADLSRNDDLELNVIVQITPQPNTCAKKLHPKAHFYSEGTANNIVDEIYEVSGDWEEFLSNSGIVACN